MAHEVVTAKACKCPKCKEGPVCFDQRYMRWIHRENNEPNGPICWSSSVKPDQSLYGTIEIYLDGVWYRENPTDPNSPICWVRRK